MIPDRPGRVLYIEDDIGLGRLLQKRLLQKNFEFDIAINGQQGLDLLKQNEYDLILLDNFLPDMTGIDMLDMLQPLDQLPPIILLTASGDERLAVQALEKGAADYAVKDTEQLYIDLLPAIMHAAFTRYRLMHENKQQKKDLENAWQKAEAASQAKSEFLATMSHEIRTPLNVISGIGSLLSRSTLDDKQREMVNVLNTNAAMLFGQVNDILDISRIESGQIELEITPFEARHVLTNMQSMFGMEAAKKGLDLVIEDNTDSIEWLGDVSRVQQILTNLVSNAIKFTEKGFVHVTSQVRRTEEDKSILQVIVKDSGIGISADKLSAIFSKFVQADQSITRRFGGSGLGLALSQSFANMMNGHITVESEEGVGSTFTVSLLLDSDIGNIANADPSVAKKGDEMNPSSHHILLVEDYPANVMIATMMLESIGCKVDVVSSGHAAVDKIKDVKKPYYAILMDIQMQGMDGFEATRQIRQLEESKGFRHLIIGATAHALVGDRERCLNSGMDDYISKPIDWGLMAQKLQITQEPSL